LALLPATLLFWLLTGCSTDQGEGSSSSPEDLRSPAQVTVQASVTPGAATANQEVTVHLSLTSTRSVTADVALRVLNPDGSVGYTGSWQSQNLVANTALTLDEAILIEPSDPVGSYRVGAQVRRTGSTSVFFDKNGLASFSVLGGGPDGGGGSDGGGESANCTVLTSPQGAPIVDAAGNKWTLVSTTTANGVEIYENGQYSTGTALVTELVYLNHVVWQEADGGGWWSWVNGAWQSGSNPTGACVVADASAAIGSCPTGSLCVSPSGTGNTCSAAAPCSLTTAQAHARLLSPTQTSDVVVTLLGGAYALDAPLSFSTADSGNAGHLVKYVAAAGASPILSGGMRISNFTLHDSAKGIYAAPVPAGFDTREVYVNGTRANRAHLSLSPGLAGPPVLGGGATATSTGYAVTIPGMTSWTNVTSIEAVAKTWWVEYRCPLASVAQGALVVDSACWSAANLDSFDAMNASLTSLENAYAFLAEPGDFYLDTTAATLYYIPRAGEDLSTATVIAARTEQLLVMDGTKNLSLEGLTFAYATWLAPNTTGFPEIQAGVLFPSYALMGSAATLSGVNGVSFKGDRFMHIGGQALAILNGSQGVTVDGNLFYDVGGGGIYLGNPNDAAQTNPALQTASDTITNTYFDSIGLLYVGTPAITAFYTRSANISHNEIANTGYDAISLGWGWGTASYAANNTIQANYIHDVMLSGYDGGGIYTLSAQSGTTLTGNFIENFGTTGACQTASGYEGWSGLYHDQGSGNYSDTNNVVRGGRCNGYWLFLQLGAAVTNNTVNQSYVDVDHVFPTGGDHTTLDQYGNVVSNVTVFGTGPLPAAAQAIVNAAGLDSSHQALKQIDTSSLY
jgi:hypothetical protein